MSDRATLIGVTLASVVAGLIVGVVIGPVAGSMVLSSPDDYMKRVEAWGSLFGGIALSFTLLFLTWELIAAQGEKEERLVFDHYNAIATQLTVLGKDLPFHVYSWDSNKRILCYKRSGRGIMELSRELVAQEMENEITKQPLSGGDERRAREVRVPLSLLFGYCEPAEALRQSVAPKKDTFLPIIAMLEFIYPRQLREFYKDQLAKRGQLDQSTELIRRAAEADNAVKEAWYELVSKDYVVYTLLVNAQRQAYHVIAEPIEAIESSPPLEVTGEIKAAIQEVAKLARTKETD